MSNISGKVKNTIQRHKITVRKTSSTFWFITDSNKTRKQTAEVIEVGSNGFNCRIDKNGKPWRYAKNIPVSNCEAAYEYTCEFGALL